MQELIDPDQLELKYGGTRNNLTNFWYNEIIYLKASYQFRSQRWVYYYSYGREGRKIGRNI